MPRPLEDLTGQTFGSWTVLGRAPNKASVKETIWTCQCSCGERQDVPKSNLKRGRSTQCTNCRDESMKKERPPRPVYTPVRGALHHRWKGELVGYSAAHRRVASERGAASSHSCVDCGAPAEDWSRNKVDCESTLYEDGLPFCTHPDHYSPRCRDCHNRYDHS